MKIGAVLYDMEEYSESLPWHMRAIQMDPYFVVAYIHLAKTYSAVRIIVLFMSMSLLFWRKILCCVYINLHSVLLSYRINSFILGCYLFIILTHI